MKGKTSKKSHHNDEVNASKSCCDVGLGLVRLLLGLGVWLQLRITPRRVGYKTKAGCENNRKISAFYKGSSRSGSRK